MTSKEIAARQNLAIEAAEMILDQITDEERLHWFKLAEFGGVSRILDRIEAPTGDALSYRELCVAGAAELLRRAIATVPKRVKLVDYVEKKKVPAKRSAKKRKK